MGEQEFKAHRLILSARSDYFRTMFSNNGYQEAKEGVVRLEEDPKLVCSHFWH